MQELVVPAALDQLETVLTFIRQAVGKPEDGKLLPQLELAAEEVFVNIANYAYPEPGGLVRIQVEAGAAIRLSFADRGIPYNPLERAAPDLTLSAEEREIGGLGIFLVIKLMDDVAYRYAEGENILTLVKQVTTK